MPSVDYLGEGSSDLLTAHKIIALAGAEPGISYYRPARGRGKPNLDKRLAGLNAGARHGRIVLVLRDLDDDDACAGRLVARLVSGRCDDLVLRIAVRSAEAWYVADADSYARFCGMRASLLPSAPEQEASLKKRLIGLAEAGRAGKLKSHLAETRSRGVADWAAMGQWHADFVRGHWEPRRAIQSGCVPSLERAVERLKERIAAISRSTGP